MISNVPFSLRLAPLQLLHFPVLSSKRISDAMKYNQEVPTPEQAEKIADKLRWYRYRKGLLQREVEDLVGMNEIVINALRAKFRRQESLDKNMHNKMMDLFRKYLLVGGLPDAVNAFLETRNIQRVREIQAEIHDYYAADASKYDEERKLKIRRIYDLISFNMENKKKWVVAQRIEDKKGKTFGGLPGRV